MSMKKPPKKLPPPKSNPLPDKQYEASARPKPSERSEVVVSEATYRQQFKGPIPHPDILRDYDAIVPGAGKDIIQSFIKEGEHRRSLQVRETAVCEEWARADVRLQGRGQIFGFIIAMSGVLGGLYVAVHGAAAAGTIVSSASLVTIVVAFLRQRNYKKPEAEDDTPDAQDKAK